VLTFRSGGSTTDLSVTEYCRGLGDNGSILQSLIFGCLPATGLKAKNLSRLPVGLLVFRVFPERRAFDYVGARGILMRPS
jgi:hypothetical protein